MQANDPDHSFRLPYYGFTHVEHATLHSDQSGGTHGRWLDKHFPDYESLGGPANQLPHDYLRPDAVRTAMPAEAYSTSWVSDRALAYIEKHADDTEPFFLMVSFADPHHPFTPAGRYWDMYATPPTGRRSGSRSTKTSSPARRPLSDG